MRRIDPNNFRVATRATPRQINRQIALNLVRTRQPISRADLARSMNMRRGAVSLLVNELIADGIIFEGATGETSRGIISATVQSRLRLVRAPAEAPTEAFWMPAPSRMWNDQSTWPTWPLPQRTTTSCLCMSREALQPSVFAWNSSPYFVVVLAADAEATRHASATTEAAAASAVRRGTDGMSHG